MADGTINVSGPTASHPVQQRCSNEAAMLGMP
jgi:hypothetical protein